MTPLDLLPPGEPRNDDYDDNFTVSTKLGLDVTQELRPGPGGALHHHRPAQHRRHFRLHDLHLVPRARADGGQDQRVLRRLFAHLSSFDGAFDQTLGFAYSRERTSTLQPDTPEALNTGERKKVDWQGNVKLAATETLVLGAEYERDAISEPISAT